jgi:hypothetical protein
MATPTTLPATFVAGNVLTAAQMNDLRGAFRILQVVQTVKTDTFATASTSFVDVTGMSATITPSSTSSKILIVVDTNYSAAADGAASAYLQLAGGNAGTYIGDAASNRVRVAMGTTGTVAGVAHRNMDATILYLDSPNTTSATTYKLQARNSSGGLGMTINRSYTDTDSVAFPRAASSITVMEISA